MTTKLLLPALLAIGTFVATLPDTAEASPRNQSSYFRSNQQGRPSQYRPGHRIKRNNVPELSVGAAAAAFGLLGGGLMVMTGRRRQKNV